MNRLKFALTSDQLELLLAFENARGLNHLAEVMARDPSVVSRNLQKIAEDQAVLKKVKGRWELTPLGVQINRQTRAYLGDQAKLISVPADESAHFPKFSSDSVLIVINAQNGLIDTTQEGRNNLDAETNIVRILEHWRWQNRRVIHVKHVSDNPESPFYRCSSSSEFLAHIRPQGNEMTVEKSKSSAFADTTLEAALNNQPCSEILLVGFTANECIDATARDAAAREYVTYVTGDATATFDLRDLSGKLVKADRIHRLTMININAFSARVLNTDDVLA